MGARMSARGSSFDSSRDRLALAYLAAAIRQGTHPREFTNDAAFVKIKTFPGFQELARQSPPPNHPPTAPIEAVEPLSE
jgi:hypothetical protein